MGDQPPGAQPADLVVLSDQVRSAGAGSLFDGYMKVEWTLTLVLVQWSASVRVRWRERQLGEHAGQGRAGGAAALEILDATGIEIYEADH